MTVDDSDADTAADYTKTTTTNGSGIWTLTLTSAEVIALDEGDLTIVVTADDAGGNSDSATKTVVYDRTAPTVSSGVYNGTTVTLFLSEGVYTPTAPVGGDFVVTDDGTAITVSSVTVASTKADASSSVALTVPTITEGSVVKVYYTKGTNPIYDSVGNTVASIASGSALTLTESALTVSAVSADDYVNGSEDDNSLTISGSSAGVASGTTVTVKADGSGTDVTKSATTGASGDWSVTLTSAEVQGLDAASPNADGESITITASATGVVSGTRSFIYDVVAPTLAVSDVATDNYINAGEDDAAVTVSGTSSGLATGTTVTVGADGTGTDVSGKTGTTNASGAWSVSLTSAEVIALGEGSITITATAG